MPDLPWGDARTKEFGVNLAAESQSWAASIAGGSHGEEVDKIAVLKELGIEFYKAKKIMAPMLKGAAMNAECKLIEKFKAGDHVAYIGEVLEASTDPAIKPLAFHDGKYWRLSEQIQKPQPEFLEKIKALVEKHRKLRF